MPTIHSTSININNRETPLHSRMIRNAGTVVHAEAGTTGLSGYCYRKKGSRTFLSLRFDRGDFQFLPILDREENIVGFSLACCGDDGLLSVMDAIEFTGRTLLDQCREQDAEGGPDCA